MKGRYWEVVWIYTAHMLITAVDENMKANQYKLKASFIFEMLEEEKQKDWSRKKKKAGTVGEIQPPAPPFISTYAWSVIQNNDSNFSKNLKGFIPAGGTPQCITEELWTHSTHIHCPDSCLYFKIPSGP